MASYEISIVNRFSGVSDDEARHVVKALQIQVDRDFAPAWGIRAKLTYVGLNEQPLPGTWQLVILDNSDVANALGYHELTKDGLPIGKVFAGTDIRAGLKWSITASHELLEMLADPDINWTVLVEKGRTSGQLFALENCDAVEADELGYTITVDGVDVLVSDFVYPEWFMDFWLTAQAPKPRFDHQNKVTAPFQLLPGGYIGVRNVGDLSGWTQLTESLADGKMPTSAQPAPGCRRHRRMLPRADWRCSLQ
jgi:hypothetical protein